MAIIEKPIIPGAHLRKERPCGDCTMCCKLIGVGPPLDKPMNRWCEHCDIGKGCKIYSDRPEECKTFYCGWKYGIGETRPDKSKVVIGIVDEENSAFYVDAGRPNAWKEPEFRELLMTLSKTTMKRVTIVVGNRRRQQVDFKKPLERPQRSAL